MKSGAGETFANRIVWQNCFNKSGQTIPPFSVVMATGWNLPDMSGFQTDSPSLNVTQADGTGAPWNHYLSWEVELLPQSFGACARPDQTPVLAKLGGGQTDRSDAAFRLCGPQKGQWTLIRDAPGFVMLAPPQNGYALVMPSRGPYVGQVPTGTAATPLVQNQTGPVTVMSGVIGSETATALTVQVYNRFATINTGAQLLFDWTGRGWEVIGGANNSATWIIVQCSGPIGPMNSGVATVQQLGLAGGPVPTQNQVTVVNFRNNTTVAGAYYVCFPISTSTNNEGKTTTLYALDNQATFL